MKTRFLFVLLLILTHSGVFASSDLSWYEGAVVLDNLEVFTGKIAVQPSYDLVLLKKDESITVLPAHKINSIYLFDEKENINRKFITVADNKNGFGAHQLFEVVVDGKISIVRRTKYFSTALQSERPKDYEYFIIQSEDIFPIQKFRNKVYPLFHSNERMQTFIKSHHFNPNIAADAISMVSFYNDLLRNQQQSWAQVEVK